MGDRSHHGDHSSHSHGEVSKPDLHGSVFGDHNTNLTEVVVTSESDHSRHGAHNTMMRMYFGGNVTEYILFESWHTTEIGGFLGSMLAVFVLAFAYEALKFYREHLYRHSFRTIQYNTVTVPVENGGSVKETQKTVQFTTKEMSVDVDPNFRTSEITPVFITKENCHCQTAQAETAADTEPDVVVSGRCSGNITNTPSNSYARASIVHQSYKVKMLSLMHTWQTILHVVQVIISYFLMLIFMTYNVWLCLAVVLGAGSGYFFFGWKKSLVVDITEHCH